MRDAACVEASLSTRDRLRNLAISESGFLFDPYTGLTFSVNGSGRAILEALRAGQAIDAITRELQGQFELAPGDDLDRDVREFVLALRDQGLLPRSEGDAA